MNLINTPLTLSDVFEKLFILVKKTIFRNMMVSLIIVVPAGFVLAWGIDVVFSQFKDIGSYDPSGNNLDVENLSSLFSFMGIYFLSLTVFMIGYLAANLGVMIIGCSVVENKEIIWQDAINEVFSIKLMKLLGLTILEVLIFGAFFIIPFILMSIASATEMGLLSFFGGLLIITAIIFSVYLFIKWSFVIPAIGWENLGVIDSFKRSFYLVKDNWWRTLGLIILVSIIIEFAVSIVTTPISLIVFWDMFAELFASLGSGGMEYGREELFANIFSSFGERFGIIMAISMILKLLLQPLLYVVLYYDLRARKKEFTIDEPETPLNPANFDDISFDSLND